MIRNDMEKPSASHKSWVNHSGLSDKTQFGRWSWIPIVSSRWSWIPRIPMIVGERVKVQHSW